MRGNKWADSEDVAKQKLSYEHRIINNAQDHFSLQSYIPGNRCIRNSYLGNSTGLVP